ncbi:MAG: hypothetical protein D6706_00665 [Chloroflexi bacterium]|nr:MAG: hypothetical protein D6706_00665 [Chloroflexota bacterium]
MIEDSNLQPNEEARRRMRRLHKNAAESILENNTLRDALTDDDAQELLDWAMAQLKQAAEVAMLLPEETAESFMTERVTAVSRIMRQVNNLTAKLPHMATEDLQFRLDDLSAALQTLTGFAPHPTDLQQLLVNRHALDNQTIFRKLMQIITERHME